MKSYKLKKISSGISKKTVEIFHSLGSVRKDKCKYKYQQFELKAVRSK